MQSNGCPRYSPFHMPYHATLVQQLISLCFVIRSSLYVLFSFFGGVSGFCACVRGRFRGVMSSLSVMSGETGGHTIQQLSSNQSSTTATLPQYSVPATQVSGASKYTQLLSVIEELGKDIRPSYTNNKICSERLKRNIIRARILVRECLIETDRSARQQ
ncbi:unnamed protein product [Acanthocheilonema viteae]|uniref:Cyclin-dependent kinase 2-associated protein n=1 Tax=Acanthocheilonema viteae TaxID=6277 RepID=A0A498S9F5_ACAVI|nr:unnamed protein product [Acanthocheilonema viteae]